MLRRVVLWALAVVVIASACTGGASGEQGSVGVVVASTTTPTVAPPGMITTTTPPPPTASSGELSPLAALVRSAGDARLDLDAPAPEAAPAPVGISIVALGVDDVLIRDVGVESNGEMEIPGGREVGWYRWSASPGSNGSAVLAAHIAFDGRDGVFRDLDRLAIGDRFVIHYADGTTSEFEVDERAQYVKDELPLGGVFANDGPPAVVLITCGETSTGDSRPTRTTWSPSRRRSESARRSDRLLWRLRPQVDPGS